MSEPLKAWTAWGLWEQGTKIQCRKQGSQDEWIYAYSRSYFWDMTLEYRVEPKMRYSVKPGVDGKDAIERGVITIVGTSLEDCAVELGDRLHVNVSLYLQDIDAASTFLALRYKREGKTLQDFQVALDRIEEIPE